MKLVGVGWVWNPKAIDYSQGTDIVDCKTNKIYTEEEAKKAPLEIRKRLVNRGRVIGAWVREKFIEVEDGSPD